MIIKNTQYLHDNLLNLMRKRIPKYSNGIKFCWSTSILNRSNLINLRDGHGNYVFEGIRNPYLFGLPVIWDRTDDEILLIAIGQP